MIPNEIQHIEDLLFLLLTEISSQVIICNTVTNSFTYCCFKGTAILDTFSHFGDEDTVAF